MTLKSMLLTAGCCLLTCGLIQAEDAPKDQAPAKDPQHGPGNREEMIKKFDKDGDGKLSEEERKAMRQAFKGRRDEMKKEIDTDGDGTISEEERKAAMLKHARERFDKLDKDKNGSLSFEEFLEGAKAHRKHMQGRRGNNGRGPGGRGNGRGPHGRGAEGGPGPDVDVKAPEAK